MKRLFLVLTLIGAMVEPAFACHRFRVWHYPWPQRCPVALGGHGRPVRLLAETPAPRPAADSLPAVAPVPPSGPPFKQAAKPPEAGASGAMPAPAAPTPSSGSAPASQASRSATPAPSAKAAPAPASGSTAPGPSAPTEAQAENSSTPQLAPAGPPSAEKGSDKPKVNDLPVNPLD